MKSLINNIKARWHLGCWLTTESEDSEVTELFLAILDKPWKHVYVSYYGIEITTSNNETLHFWNANKYYGWASKGSISGSRKTLYWNNKRPSMYAMYLMVKRLEQWTVNEKPRLISVLQ